MSQKVINNKFIELRLAQSKLKRVGSISKLYVLCYSSVNLMKVCWQNNIPPKILKNTEFIQMKIKIWNRSLLSGSVGTKTASITMTQKTLSIVSLLGYRWFEKMKNENEKSNLLKSNNKSLLVFQKLQTE